MRVAVTSSKAPAVPANLMSQGIIANGFVFTSGAVGKDPVTGDIVKGPIEARTHRCIQNLAAVLEAGGSSVEDVIEVNIFITDMSNYGAVNKVYEQYWGQLKPARTCVAVKTLPGNTDVEIKCVGLVKSSARAKL
ncbi:hypothetical protein G7054_g970 [Neopestalotiopsis clavispora]|nr:hypothetical protein G7054_g970 [Neopestalotiopsis clavispora]